MSDLNVVDLGTLAAVVDRIVPADQDPGAVMAGTVQFVANHLRQRHDLAKQVCAAFVGLHQAAGILRSCRFDALPPGDQDRVLAGRQEDAWFLALVELTGEGFYADPGNGGNAEAISWTMIGYDPRLPPRTTEPAPISIQQVSSAQGIEEFYDAVVVGAGAGGGIAACVLAEAGHRVLLLERGRDHGPEDPLARDHLRNQRLSAYGHNAGPEIEGNPRVVVDPDGSERVVKPHEPGYENNAAALGGGTLVYGAQAWRFHPDDFRMASRYGIPEGSSLVDWPIKYDELEPYYGRAEWDIGTAGEPGHAGTRSRDFPMPPLPGYASRRILRRGAERLGLATFAPPLLVNSILRDGRGPCDECGSCVGFRCPSGAKNGTQNTVIPRALKTGRCRLMTSATVTRVDTDDAGIVSGVTFHHQSGTHSRQISVRARAVVLCGGAIETARLLLLSASARHSRGLGNENDLVGRNLQGHFAPMVYGLFNEQTYDSRGPGVTIGTCSYNHDNPGIIGGSMIADDFIMLPVIFWKRALPPGLPRWGAESKEFMRRNYRRVMRVFAPVQEIPSPDVRVTLDPRVRDRFGLPVARLSGVVHPETLRTAKFMQDRATEWLRASGAVRTWSDPLVPRLSAGQHQAGTCRMGSNKETSVTDSHGRVWNHENLFVSDASLHVTNGGFNPVLTIMALAFRNSEHIARFLDRRA